MLRFKSEIIPALPPPVRAAARGAVWRYGRATAHWRPLPDFVVIGAMKSGTTALYAFLHWHPEIVGPAWKETSFFSRYWNRGEPWYRAHFPMSGRRAGVLVGEASPSYLFDPRGPERVKQLIPDAKLVAILRDPVDRAYSHWQHERALHREPLSFEEALAAEDARLAGEVPRMLADTEYFSQNWWDFAYVGRGLYADQLERWYSVFPEEQLLVLTNEDFDRDPRGVYHQVLRHIGAKPHDLDEYPRVFDRDYTPMLPATRAMLEARFAEPNARLERMLGYRLGWSSPAPPRAIRLSEEQPAEEPEPLVLPAG